MEESDQEMIQKALEDARRWLAEAPTPEVKKYRMGIVLDALQPGMRFHYYRDQGSLFGNEEWDRGSANDERGK